MEIFFVMLIIISVMHFVFNVSLFNGARPFIGIIIISIINYNLFDLSLNINSEKFLRHLQNFDNLSFVCALLILEAIVSVFISIGLVSQILKEKKIRGFYFIFSMFSSFMIVPSLFYCQTALFHFVSGYSYQKIALFFNISVFLFLSIIVLLIKNIIKERQHILDIKFNILFLEIVIAMFLPYIIKGYAINNSQFDTSIQNITITLLAMVGVVILGFYLSEISITLVNLSKLIKSISNPIHQKLEPIKAKSTRYK
jgi:hypothetical protein